MPASNYLEYIQSALDDFASYSDERKYSLVNALGEAAAADVLDVGCGAGQQLLPFAERRNSKCVGVDAAPEVSSVGSEVFEKAGFAGKGEFICAFGEDLPFEDESFDVVICRVALPYMENRKAIAEMARVMRPHGKLFLKTHAPAFYFGMLRERIKLLNPKQLAYPLICLTGGTLNLLTGKQPQGGIWNGKEVFQTRGFLEQEFKKNKLRIVRELVDSNSQTPSYLIEKT